MGGGCRGNYWSPTRLHMFLSFSVLSTVQINHFTPSPSHSASDNQSFWFRVNIFSRSALARGEGGVRKQFFLPGPEPTFGGLSGIFKYPHNTRFVLMFPLITSDKSRKHFSSQNPGTQRHCVFALMIVSFSSSILLYGSRQCNHCLTHLINSY